MGRYHLPHKCKSPIRLSSECLEIFRMNSSLRLDGAHVRDVVITHDPIFTWMSHNFQHILAIINFRFPQSFGGRKSLLSLDLDHE
jgi:hypothetical protein